MRRLPCLALLLVLTTGCGGDKSPPTDTESAKKAQEELNKHRQQEWNTTPKK